MKSYFEERDSLTTRSRERVQTANLFMGEQYFTVIVDGMFDFHLTPLQGHYKKISKTTWKREGRVFTCCPLRLGKKAFLRFVPMAKVEHHPELPKSLWNISFHSSGGFDYWYLWSENVNPEASRWFFNNQSEANLIVRAGKHNMCCCLRGTLGSCISCQCVPLIAFVVGCIIIAVQIISTTFAICFGVLFFIMFQILLCCCKSAHFLTHRDFYVEDCQNSIELALKKENNSQSDKDRKEIVQSIMEFTDLRDYPGWFTLQNRRTCNIGQWQTWALHGHYQKVGWLNDRPLYKRWGKVYTWSPFFQLHQDVWLFHGGQNSWYFTFEKPVRKGFVSKFIFRSLTESYTYPPSLGAMEWFWDDESAASVKLLEGRSWIMNSVCCPTLSSFIFFMIIPSLFIIAIVIMATMSFISFVVLFAPIIIVLSVYLVVACLRNCGCCCCDDQSDNLREESTSLMQYGQPVPI